MTTIKKSSARPQLGTTDGSGDCSFDERGIETDHQSRAVERGAAGSLRLGQAEKVAVYARVSTQLQEKEDTVKSQLSAIEEHLNNSIGPLAQDNIFVDEGYSGSTLVRPALDKLRDGVAEGLYETVVVYDPDRLARSYVYQMLLLEEFEKQGCRLHFVRRPIGKSPDEQLLLQMQGVISEYERAKIRERTRRGKMHRMREGEIISGHRTFGYRYASKSGGIPAHFEVIPEEADVIRKIFTWYTQERVSMLELARRLNDAGVSPLRGKRWYRSNMSLILNNSMYTGTGYANKFKSVCPRKKPFDNTYRKYPKTSQIQRPRDQWLPFSCPPIIDEETFELAQLRLDENKRMAARRTKKQYLLRGLITCAHCGKKMLADTQSKRYICPYTRKTQAQQFGFDTCSNNVRHLVSDLDDAIWKETTKLICKPSTLKSQYKRLKGKIVPKVSGSHSALKEKKEKILQQRKRATSLCIQGMLSEKELRDKYRMLSDKIHAIDQQIKKLDEDRVAEEDIEQMLKSFTKFSKTIQKQAKDPDFETKRTIIEQLIKGVIISKTDVTIEYAAPLKRNNLRTVNHYFLTTS